MIEKPNRSAFTFTYLGCVLRLLLCVPSQVRLTGMPVFLKDSNVGMERDARTMDTIALPLCVTATMCPSGEGAVACIGGALRSCGWVFECPMRCWRVAP